mmetsp:Transcript_22486/g.33538  ORF Transcript_22486/g.33538 Transcript_22486/m.33538 type:complete len:234 (-) Transcript_22486:14-715(-)
MPYVPWAVTANVLFKWRGEVEFDLIYPKTGGGEDIDFCISMGARLVPVPGAKVAHPWRKTAFSMWWRMVHWAIGDQRLLVKHSQYAFLSFPNYIEVSFFAVVFIPLLLGPFHLSTWTFLSSFLSYLTFGEILRQTFWHIFLIPPNEWHRTYESSPFWKKIVVSIASTFFINASALGHLIGSFAICRPDLLLWRFNWMLDLSEDATKSLQSNTKLQDASLFSFALATFIALLLL